MPRRLPRPARLALGLTKVAAIGTIAVAALATQPATPSGPASSGPGYAGYPVHDAPTPEARLLALHHCSPAGFADATPLSAIVRTARGELQHVSFDVGWEVYTRRGVEKLVAVCLGWAGLEFYGGSPNWGMIALAFAGYAAWQYLWLYKPPKGDAAEPPVTEK